MVKQLELNDYLKKRKRSRVVFFVSLCLSILTLIGTVVCAVLMPKNKVYATSDGSTVTAITVDTDGEWYFSTTSSKINCLDANNNILEEFDFKANVSKKYGQDFKAGSILNVNASIKSDYIWVTTTEQKLFRLTRNGKMEIDGYANLTGAFCALTEDDDGYVYVITKPSYYLITKYSADDMQPEKSGIIYNVTRGASVKLRCVSGLSIQCFDVYDDYLYIFYRSGFYRIHTSLQAIDYGLKLNGAYTQRYGELYENAVSELEEGQTITADAKKALKEQAITYACQSYGAVAFDPDTGEVQLSPKDCKESAVASYFLDNWTSSGVAVDGETRTIYTLSNDGIYKYGIDDIEDFGMVIEEASIVQLPITLAGTPAVNTSSAMFYNSVTGKAYIIYNNMPTVSFVDLRNEEHLFDVELNYNISSIIHDLSTEKAYYLYSDTVNYASGTSLLKSVDMTKQLKAETTSTVLTVCAIALAVALLTMMISLLFTKSIRFASWAVDVVKDFKKQWILYGILLASLIFLIMFCYYPAAGSIFTSFFNYTRDNPERIWNNFANYKSIFTNPYAGEAFKNMFIYLFFDVLFALLPPLIFAFCLTIMRNKKYSGLSRTLLFIPGIIPGIATTLIWKTGVYGEYGIINTLIQLFGGKSTIVTQQSSTALWALILMGFPFVGSYLVFYGAMMNIPSSYYEAAELDGITVIKRFIYIDVPLIMSQIKYVFILTFIGSVQNFGRTDLITNGLWGDKTPIFQMYKLMQEHGKYGEAAAYATILFLFLFAATVINLRMQTQDKGDY
ncbi:MAG: sugar ABC transporter permease [Clostridia bacterium]|nr:sugar ABC transporter permease [Clostridia bacterium]